MMPFFFTNCSIQFNMKIHTLKHCIGTVQIRGDICERYISAERNTVI
jgi:hypothetical protein